MSMDGFIHSGRGYLCCFLRGSIVLVYVILQLHRVQTFSLQQLLNTKNNIPSKYNSQQQHPTMSHRNFVTPASSSSSSTSSTDQSIPDEKSMNENSMKLINGCKDLINDYDIFLLDMWGVLHDGTTPYDGVIECVEKLYQAGKKLVILSNSSKRKNHTIKMLQKLGFQSHWFDYIITSGEVAYNMLCESSGTNINNDSTESNTMLAGDWYKQWDGLCTKNKNVFIFGSGDNDTEYCTSCGWNVSELKDASLLIARGTFTINDGHKINIAKDKNDDPSYYDEMVLECLQQAASKRIPLLICNPDKIRPDSDRSPMPGQYVPFPISCNVELEEKYVYTNFSILCIFVLFQFHNQFGIYSHPN
jgi:ribonucleotide monophosphatase NagD (HAD superfamily)